MTEVWKGIYKIQEEMGELGQVLGKLGPFPDVNQNHPDGTNLRQLMIDEIADVRAALWYFEHENDLKPDVKRVQQKFRKFKEWGLTGIVVPDT